MPVRRGSVTFSRFKVSGRRPKDERRWLLGALRTRCFTPVDPQGDEERSAGFVELVDDRRTAFAVGDVFLGQHAVWGFRVERLKVPAAKVRAGLVEWAQRFEAESGRPPSRRERTEQKEVLRRALRAKVEPSVKVFDLSWELRGGDLLVWAAARTVVDEIVGILEDELELRLTPRGPASFATQAVLDGLEPTISLFAEGAAHG